MITDLILATIWALFCVIVSTLIAFYFIQWMIKRYM